MKLLGIGIGSALLTLAFAHPVFQDGRGLLGGCVGLMGLVLVAYGLIESLET